MYKLKGAIFSLRDVLLTKGAIDVSLFEQTVSLLKFLIHKGVEPVLISNHAWIITGNGEKKGKFEDVLSHYVGKKLPYYQGGLNIPFKPLADATKEILTKHGWLPSEVVYVGATDEDMRTARNGRLLFLNAKWHGSASEYGFEFESPVDIARFLDCCCISVGDWFWKVENSSLRVYAIAPFAEYSKYYPSAATYSTDAKATAKLSSGDVVFWGRLLAARIHFSGLAAEINYLAPYPGHSPTSNKPVLAQALKILAGSFHANYLEDVILRHSLATKSQTARQQGKTVDHLNQLRTIRLRPDPLKPGPQGGRYKSTPLRPGKVVLVVDDICTQGFSGEAARHFLEKTGVTVINLAWLKTPGNNDYVHLTGCNPELKDPYKPFPPQSVTTKIFGNSSHVLNSSASQELASAFERYHNWKWPT